jgi:hypothetical protein
MNIYVEHYATLINSALPFLLIVGCFTYLSLRLHLVTQVTPRIDKINGYSTTRKFKINFHQSKLYRQCFLNADHKYKAFFKVGTWDLSLFHAEKYLARSILILIPITVSFLTYTHTLVA